MPPYTPTIGLEIHAELKTSTKMFCSSLNNPDEEHPNVNICPVCMAYPGTLPVVNRAAVAHVLRMGAAIDGELADYTEFDRKNYFYPDIPKGYQISQYEYPLVKGGALAGVAVTRIHLEEDTANSKHVGEHSLIDYNRAGIPLMELVTEPVIHDAVTASTFAKELQILLRTLGAGEANMEKGQMRVEVNISVSRDATLGVKTEVKNLNSFKSVERAIASEIDRQIKTLESGGTLVQETRGFNEVTGETFSQRLKESSHDYRYFPDPDIPKFRLSLIDVSKEKLQATLPELPWVRRARYQTLKLKADDIETLVTDSDYAAFFDNEIIKAGLSERVVALAANYLMTDVRGVGAGAAELERVSNGGFKDLMAMIEADELSSHGAKTVLTEMLKVGGGARALAEKLNVLQETDTETLKKVVAEVIVENPSVAEEYRAGKVAVMQFLIGQAMKKSGGKAKPSALKDLIHSALS